MGGRCEHTGNISRNLISRGRLNRDCAVIALKTMDFVLKTMGFVLKTMDFVLKTMDFTLKTMDFTLKMIDFTDGARLFCVWRSERAARVCW